MKTGIKIAFIFLLLISTTAILIWFNLSAILEKQLEAALNKATQKNLRGSLDLEGVELSPDFRASIHKLTGTWHTDEGVFSFEIHNLLLKNPVTDLIFRKPSEIDFEHFRPRGSVHEGVTGKVLLNQSGPGSFELNADLVELYLEEITDLDSVNLRNTSGRLAGSLTFKASAERPQEFKFKVKVVEPGGQVQAKFFNLILPYLPLADQKILVSIQEGKTVSYQEADIWAELEGPKAIKLLLHIKVPDYNLNLNLNMKVRLESEDSLMELARLSGLLKVKNS